MNRHGGESIDRRAGPNLESHTERDEGPLAVLATAAQAARRRIVPLVIWLIICLSCAAWYLHVTSPTYTAFAAVILDPKRPATQTNDNFAALSPPILDAATVESQIQVIRSERLLFSVFGALDLANAYSLRPSPPGLFSSVFSRTAALFRTFNSVEDDEGGRSAAAFDAFTSRVGRAPRRSILRY